MGDRKEQEQLLQSLFSCVDIFQPSEKTTQEATEDSEMFSDKQKKMTYFTRVG